MFKLKKGVSLILAIVMLVGILCGCQEEKQESFEFDKSAFAETNGLELPISKEPVTLNVLVSSSVEKLEDTMFVKALEELTGIKLKITTVPSSGYTNRLQMLLASKQLPDIGVFMELSHNEIEGLVNNDVLVAFDEHLDMLPNYKKLFIDDEENHEIVMNGAVNGHLYFASSYDINRDINHGFLYRKDIFDKHGIKPWTNTEEFYQALKKLKEIYPESTPLVSKYKVPEMLGYYGSMWNLDLDSGFTKDKESGKYIYAKTSPDFKDMLDFLRKLYAEGLMDPEFLTCTEASWAAKMTQDGKGFVTFDWIDRMDIFYDQVKATNPDFNLRFGRPIGTNAKYPKGNKVYSSGLFVVNNDKKEYAMKLIDFLLSPAGAKLSTLGIEGISYKLNEEGKVEYLGIEGEKPNITNLESKYGLFNATLSPRFDRSSVYYQFSPKLQEAQDMAINGNIINDRAYMPVTVEKRADEYNDIFANLNRESEIFVSNYILDIQTNADDMWANWIKKADELGVKTLTEIYNENSK